MENKIEVFTKAEFGELRTVNVGDKIMFVASDVAKALGYSRPADAITAHCKGSVKHRLPTNGGMQELKIIPEGDVYRLITHSKLPAAEKFESWVFDEVLPSIRKTGQYSAQSPQTFGEALMLAAKQQVALEEKEKKIAALNEEQERLLIENTKQGETINEQGEQIIKLTSDISQMKPKVDYCDIILQSISTVLITQIAQDYGMSAVAFNKKLAELHIQHKVNNQWILYAPYVSMGYVQSKPVNIPLPDGTTKIRLNTEWTQKGRLFLYEKLKSHNIVPLIEK